jgi:uncharacterized protein YggE
MQHFRLLMLPIYLVMLALALFTPAGSVCSQARDVVPVLTVVGSGEAAARPDTAEVQAGIVSEASTAREALDANTTAMQALYKTLTAFNMAERDRQTVAFNVSPTYSREERRGQPPRIVAYRVENRVRLTIRELDRLGELLDALVTQGANTIHSIQFRVGNPKPVLDQARQAAVEEARHKATLYARAAGVALGRVLALREEQAAPPTPMPVAERMMAAEAAVPMAPGEATFTVRVVVTYELVGQ